MSIDDDYEDDDNEDNYSNVDATALLLSLPADLRTKIINPPENETARAKIIFQTIKALIDRDVSYKSIRILFNKYPIGNNIKNLDELIKKVKNSNLGEEKLSQDFISKHLTQVRFCHSWEKWVTWNGNYWEQDLKGQALYLMCEYLRDAQIPEFRKRASTIKGIEYLSKLNPLISTINDDWDNNPLLLATEATKDNKGGTIDLTTGELRPSKPEDLITKATKVSPINSPPILWLKFLHDATQGNEELISYLQRMAGYCLTGSIKEESLFFLFGEGGNGKGTFINTITAILGTYATVAPMETFVENKFGVSHPTELAMLRGARLVTAQETEEGKSWNETRIKSLTGGDPITARLMYKDFFTFNPTFKLVISGNHAPSLKTVDDAIKRRFNKLPFVFKPNPPDLLLKEKLKSEYPQILQWMIDGCLQWQSQGLNPPKIVLDSTDDYFLDQDFFSQWVEEKLEITPNKSSLYQDLQASWYRFASLNHQRQGDARMFKSRMEKLPGVTYERNVKDPKTNKYQRGYNGIGFK